MSFKIFDVNGQILIFEPIVYDFDILIDYKIRNNDFIEINHHNYFAETEIFEFIESLQHIEQYSSQIHSMKSLVDDEFICNFSAPNSDLIVEIKLIKRSIYQNVNDSSVHMTMIIPFEYKNTIIQRLRMLNNQIVALKQS
ncbi:hypothetical protein [Acinetobacter ursingii]|uniref:Uncharacterized protein n=1 Tax=Acinetobacter ursingii TaxID=108980 RepID=A0A7T9Z6B4_9GAMM|nr:hypothetical protein [Acinetobacter ursingii]ECE6725645.1 hypothetical protein [Salmonella enterica subsp. enterica serovar Paratyphi A]MCH2015051.1 hypothetical protein [Acinetobacter ursingii]MCU4524545.1 hypothetical protein [Acinetobacter ursingii]QQT86397.1 hypothetical protein I6I53_00815 [Acinetobacter ursingii]VTX89819.1 Uncharacterised protein [Acinetobacter ursingii]